MNQFVRIYARLTELIIYFRIYLIKMIIPSP